MKITVGDVMEMGSFWPIRQMTDDGGLDREIRKCLLLDQDPSPSSCGSLPRRELADKLVLSHLHYAKGDEHLVFDTVVSLINGGACGLVIHDRYRVKLSERTLEYANSKRFPIYLVEGDGFCFEDFIVDVADIIRQLENPRSEESIVNTIIRTNVSGQEKIAQIHLLNPNIDEYSFSICILPQNTHVQFDYYRIYQQFRDNRTLFSNRCSCVRYKKGCLLIYSDRFLQERDFLPKVEQLLAALTLPQQERYSIGIGKLHQKLEEMQYNISESIYAAIYNLQYGGSYTCYEDLGVFQILLPLIKEPWMQAYYRSVIEEIYSFDCINNTSFCDTLCAYCDSMGDVKQTAARLQQHENSIRYRLRKIHELFGWDYKNPRQRERLTLSTKMLQANRMIKQYNAL